MNIEIPDLPGNSNMEKAAIVRKERKNEDDVTPKRRSVAHGHISNKTSGSSITELLVKQDLKSAADFAFRNVAIPKMQSLIVDAATSIIRGIFLGENAAMAPTSTRSFGSHVDYQGKFRSGASRTKASQVASSGFKYDIIEFDSFGEAQLVLDKLDEILSDQGVVTVADMFECADLSCPWTYTYYGWTNLSSAKIVTDGEVYRIKMPMTKRIEE